MQLYLPRVFAIGFDGCGGDKIASYFAAAGHGVVSGQDAPVALDILRCRATGQRPLTAWPKAQVFVDLYAYHQAALPMLDGFRAFGFLKDRFPDAVFLLNTRSPDGWLRDRTSIEDVFSRSVHATREELAAKWLQDWEDHHTAVSQFFKDDPGFIELDMEGTWQQRLYGDLGDLFGLAPPDPTPAFAPSGDLAMPSKITTKLPPHFIELVEDLSVHCVGSLENRNAPDFTPPSATQWAHWDGATRVSNQAGDPLPIVRVGAGNADGWIPTQMPMDPQIQRTVGLLNEMRHILPEGQPVTCDMQDARPYGRAHPNPPSPIFAYNRRPEAQNTVLWPLVGYHSPGTANYVSVDPVDPIPYRDKIDLCVWRGNLTGATAPELNPENLPRGGSIGLLNRLADPGTTEAERDAILQRLDTIPRYHLTRRLQTSLDFDFALTLPPSGKLWWRIAR